MVDAGVVPRSSWRRRHRLATSPPLEPQQFLHPVLRIVRAEHERYAVYRDPHEAT